jgi:hypothetical protein
MRKIDEGGHSIVKLRYAVCPPMAASLKKLLATSNIKNVRNDKSDMSVAIATHHHDNL